MAVALRRATGDDCATATDGQPDALPASASIAVAEIAMGSAVTRAIQRCSD
jgi:hypothetical protein